MVTMKNYLESPIPKEGIIVSQKCRSIGESILLAWLLSLGRRVIHERRRAGGKITIPGLLTKLKKEAAYLEKNLTF